MNNRYKKIVYDYNNLIDTNIIPEDCDKKLEKKIAAISQGDIDSMMPELEKAKKSLSNKWGKSSKMMAWTKSMELSDKILIDICKTAKQVQKGFDNFVIFGIGGSALGPIAVQNALNHLHYNSLPKDQRSGPKLFVEDNVDPERMNALLDIIDVERTCFNIITKSGKTAETMSQYLICQSLLKERLGDQWYKNIIATTDKKQGNLIKIAKENKIKTFVIPDGVGGRYSELSPVGLLPAAVCGIDIKMMLEGASFMDEICMTENLKNNPGYMAGLLMYIAMEKKKKNIQVIMPYADSLKYFADWYAQLWAESLGKKETTRGKMVHCGQTPVGALGVTDQHSQIQLYTEGPFDKVITFIKVEEYRSKYTIPYGCEDIPDVSFLGGKTLNELIHAEQKATEVAVTAAGKLNQTIMLPEVNAHTIGQLMYFFMVQTAVCGELLKIDAFNQPGVEAGKIATYALLGKEGYEEDFKKLQRNVKKSNDYVI
ncbi:MAG: glucose-6-phosphate isomerase [Clostridiales bacterium]|nr:glucose-6-phosphate isomerase [Clostridiales bacterium]